jgi:hypothetical protein
MPLPRRRERYGLLLLSIFIVFGIEGVANAGKWQQIVSTTLLGVTLLLALWAADAKPIVLALAVVMAVGVVALSVVEAVNGNVDEAATRLANALLVLLAPPAIIVGVVRTLRARQKVTLEAVFGVLCVYILLGMLFAFVYGTLDRLGESPFFTNGQPATISHCLYFSFTTITTVGYGDFTARTNLGHTLSSCEALLGQIYLVTVVSLIVANLGRAHPVRQPSEQPEPPPAGAASGV